MEESYQSLRLCNQLCFPIYLCSKELVNRYEPMLRPLNLTYSQYVLMMYLWEVGSATATRMSRCLLLDASTLTPLLKKLEHKGYIRRERSNEDRRNYLIALTPEGEALKRDALSVPAEMGCCVDLNAQEAAELYRLINKVIANLRKEASL